MEIYDRFRQRQQKPAFQDPTGWVMLSNTSSAELVSQRHGRLVLGVTGVSPRQRFPKEVCAPGTLGHHGHVCLSRGTSPAGASGRQAQRTLLESQRAAALQGPGDRLAPDSFLPHDAVTSCSISRTFWSGGMSAAFGSTLTTHREAGLPSTLLKFSFYKHTLLTELKSCSLSTITRYSQGSSRAYKTQVWQENQFKDTLSTHPCQRFQQSKFLPILIRRDGRHSATGPGRASVLGRTRRGRSCGVPGGVPFINHCIKKILASLDEKRSYYIQIFNILTLQKFYFYNRVFLKWRKLWKNFKKKLMIY